MIGKTVFCWAVIILSAIAYEVAYSASYGEINNEHNIVNIQSQDRENTIDAIFYPTEAKKAVILIPEWSFPKESFIQFAQKLRNQGFVVLVIEGDVVLEATNFLLSKGIEEINMIGAGFGGEVILHALQNPVSSRIKRIIMISPYEAVPVRNNQIKKLFIASKKDWQVPVGEVTEAYNKSTSPKYLELFTGSAHGQSFFESKFKEKIINLIIDFLKT